MGMALNGGASPFPPLFCPHAGLFMMGPYAFLPEDGFVSVSAILSQHRGHGFSSEDVQRVVAACPKQRFALRDDPATGQLQIRANQGHSIEVGVYH